MHLLPFWWGDNGLSELYCPEDGKPGHLCLDLFSLDIRQKEKKKKTSWSFQAKQRNKEKKEVVLYEKNSLRTSKTADISLESRRKGWQGRLGAPGRKGREGGRRLRQETDEKCGKMNKGRTVGGKCREETEFST